MFASRKLVIVVACLLVTIAGSYMFYSYLYRDARNISDEKALFIIDAWLLAKEYSTDAERSDQKYLNKTILVRGMITSAYDSVVTLDSVVFCGFQQPVNESLSYRNIKVKGRCIGYDELFGEVKLDQCTIVE